MTAPAGWYDDGSGAQRCGDGKVWTSHVALPDPFAGGPGVASGPRKSKLGLYIGIGVGVFVVFAAMTISAVMVFIQQKEAASPRATFDDLVVAWQAKDCAGEYDVSLVSTTDSTVSDYCDGADYEWVDAYRGWVIDVTSVDESGDTGTVTTHETYNDLDTGQKVVENWSYGFERVGGTWLYVDAELVE